MNGYSHPAYAASLAEFGRPQLPGVVEGEPKAVAQAAALHPNACVDGFGPEEAGRRQRFSAATERPIRPCALGGRQFRECYFRSQTPAKERVIPG